MSATIEIARRQYADERLCAKISILCDKCKNNRIHNELMCPALTHEFILCEGHEPDEEESPKEFRKLTCTSCGFGYTIILYSTTARVERVGFSDDQKPEVHIELVNAMEELAV